MRGIALPALLTDKLKEGYIGIHYSTAESSVAQEAEAEAEDRVEVVADTEHGAQGEADGARGKAGGGNRAVTPPA